MQSFIRNFLTSCSRVYIFHFARQRKILVKSPLKHGKNSGFYCRYWSHKLQLLVGTNLIHDFKAVTFSVKVFRVLSTAFVRILLFATCHITSALSSWHVFTVLLTYINVKNFHGSLTTVVRAQNDTTKTANITDTIFDITLV